MPAIDPVPPAGKSGLTAPARGRQGTVIGPRGRVATRPVPRQHGDVSSSTTGPNGRTASVTVAR